MALFGTSVKEDSFIRQLKLQAEKTVNCIEFLEKNLDSITDSTIKEKKNF